MFTTAASLIIATALAVVPQGFLKFSETPVRTQTNTTVEVGVLVGDAKKQNYWLRRTIESSGKTQLDWTDTARCPAARSAIENATKLTPPSIWVPGVDVRPDGSVQAVADGVDYEFTSDAHWKGTIGSEIHFSSNVSTPLAQWVDETLSRLRSCWSKEPPAGKML